MDIINFVNAWKDLVVKVYTEYLLAGALCTLVAIGVFYWLQKEKKFSLTINLFLLLLGWSILVPIVGLLIDLIKWIIDVLKTIFSFISSIYEIYAKHPLIFIIISTIALIFYFVWIKIWPNIIRQRWLRILILIVSTVILMYIISPIVDAITPNKSNLKNKEKEMVDTSKSSKIETKNK